jgi:hypothetical protein
VFEKLSLIAVSRPGLKIGANRTKSTEGTKTQSTGDLQSVLTDFARETVIENHGRANSGAQKLSALFKHPLSFSLCRVCENALDCGLDGCWRRDRSGEAQGPFVVTYRHELKKRLFVNCLQLLIFLRLPQTAQRSHPALNQNAGIGAGNRLKFNAFGSGCYQEE